MRPILAQILIIAASIGLPGCQTGPNVPNDIGDQSVIDEYKHQCKLRVLERPHP